MTVVVAVTAAALLAGTAGVARADGSATSDDPTVLPCRPTVTCTADLAAPGTLEVELGYQFRRSDGVDTSTIPLLVKLPVTSWLELQLGDAGYTFVSGTSYLDNITIGAKLHILDQTAARPSFAITATASAPGPVQAGYAHLTDALVTAQASKDLGRLHLDADVGVIALSLEENPKIQPWAAVAATYAVTHQVGIVVEPHAFASASPIAPQDYGAIAAVEVAVKSWLIVDGAIDVTLSTPQAIAALVGVSIAPVRLWGGR
jgi:hypothetical protein